METMGYQLEELIPLVAELAAGYGGYEHTSITYERAEMLMEAVLYCIHECAEHTSGAVSVGRIPAREAYEIGQQIVIRKVKRLHDLYNDMILDFRDYGMECLRDTIGAVPLFLQRYDVRYAPQETLLLLDYPIPEDLRGLSGVDLVLAYVEYICREQAFLRRFDEGHVMDVLRAYHPEYEILVENICEIMRADMEEDP